MPRQFLNYTITASVSYVERQALKRLARDKKLTVSALLRELVNAAVSGQGAAKP